MNSSSQILREAESLKSSVSESSLEANETWTTRQKLQDLYQKLLILDLEYALDKKVEQDLWNYAFKNHINTLQTKSKDKKNPRRGEILANLTLFLETASGFYLQLFQELCNTFSLDLPCRKKPASLGIIQENKINLLKIKPPHKSSCLYICQHCLVHLGDIARYRNQGQQAETFYRHAAQLIPTNGQPYNQLAILEAAKGDKLSTVFYYIRSIAVKHPFPAAATNLQKLYSKIVNESSVMDLKGKLSQHEVVSAFLHFHALIHLSVDFDRAKKISSKLNSALPSHFSLESFSWFQIVQIVTINLFAIQEIIHPGEMGGKNGIIPGNNNNNINNNNNVTKQNSSNYIMSEDEKLSYELLLDLTGVILSALVLQASKVKEEKKAREFYTLPAIKLLLDWLRQNPETYTHSILQAKLNMWPNLTKLLNLIQILPKDEFNVNKFSDQPLSEDCCLQGFLPLQKAHGELNFKKIELPAIDVELKLRASRLIVHGQWICENLQSLNVMTVQMVRAGKAYLFETFKQLQSQKNGMQTLTVNPGKQSPYPRLGTSPKPGLSPTSNIISSLGSGQAQVLENGNKCNISKERKNVRQNVAIQAIMQRKTTTPPMKSVNENRPTTESQIIKTSSQQQPSVVQPTPIQTINENHSRNENPVLASMPHLQAMAFPPLTPYSMHPNIPLGPTIHQPHPANSYLISNHKALSQPIRHPIPNFAKTGPNHVHQPMPNLGNHSNAFMDAQLHMEKDTGYPPVIMPSYHMTQAQVSNDVSQSKLGQNSRLNMGYNSTLKEEIHNPYSNSSNREQLAYTNSASSLFSGPSSSHVKAPGTSASVPLTNTYSLFSSPWSVGLPGVNNDRSLIEDYPLEQLSRGRWLNKKRKQPLGKGNNSPSFSPECNTNSDRTMAQTRYETMPPSVGLGFSFGPMERSWMNPAETSLLDSGNVGHTLLSNNIQSLWSTPGPSPLERLLEQQKQQRDSAPH